MSNFLDFDDESVSVCSGSVNDILDNIDDASVVSTSLESYSKEERQKQIDKLTLEFDKMLDDLVIPSDHVSLPSNSKDKTNNGKFCIVKGNKENKNRPVYNPYQDSYKSSAYAVKTNNILKTPPKKSPSTYGGLDPRKQDLSIVKLNQLNTTKSQQFQKSQREFQKSQMSRSDKDKVEGQFCQKLNANF